MKPFSNNPRQITKKQMERLQDKLARLGDLSGIVHNQRTDEIIGGNQRMMIFGMGQEPVITERYETPDEQGTLAHGYITWQGKRYAYRLVDWDEQTAREANIAANLEGGDWDWDVLANAWEDLQEYGFGPDVLENWRRDVAGLDNFLKSEESEGRDAEPEVDRAAELLEKWQVSDGDVWVIGDHRLLCGSSTIRDNVARLFGDERARLTWTDPPYGVKYGDKMEAANPMGYRVRRIENDDLPADQLEEFIRSALKHAAEFSVPGAAVYVACPAGTPLPALISSFAGSGFDFRWGLVWLKDQIVLSRADYHFKHENILYGWKGDGAHYFTADRTQSSVFEYPRPKKSDEHPTMKPVALVQHMIKNSSESGDIVYDAFGGSGSTMLACENSSRRCRMIELSPAYASVVLERMSTAFPELDIHLIESVSES